MGIEEKINNLDFNSKIKLWLHYVSIQSALNNFKELIENPNPLFFENIQFPVLKATFSQNKHNLKILSFDDFIDNNKNINLANYPVNGYQKNYTGIFYWYERFSNEVLNKT